MEMKTDTVLALVLCLLIAGCVRETERQQSQIANPASVYCVEHGYELEMRENENGTYGVCVFGEEECEEWAFFRGECGAGYATLGCEEDSDCVAWEQCHPTRCVLRTEALEELRSREETVFCSQECVPGTMDCGQGRCACVDGNCTVVWA